MEFQKVSSSEFLGGLSLVDAAAIRRNQSDFGAHESSDLLSKTKDESGWISDHEIDRQIAWNSGGVWGYAFETELTKSEVILRYQKFPLQEYPVTTHGGYTLFDRTHSWHAVDKTGVIKIPTSERVAAKSYLDSVDTKRSPPSDLQRALAELDSKYTLSVIRPYPSGRSFKDSGIDYRGLCRSFSPITEQQGFTMTTGIFTDSPKRLAEWAAEKPIIVLDDTTYREPSIRATDGLVVLVETGTVRSFATYR